jgi:hypothetical protein
VSEIKWTFQAVQKVQNDQVVSDGVRILSTHGMSWTS